MNAICLQSTAAKLGVAVCEDFWNDKTFWKERLYAHDPADELIEMGAQMLDLDQRFSVQ